MASILAPWWPKFSLEAVEARGYSSVPNQCQDWEKFQRQKRGQPQDWRFASDFATDLAMKRSQYKIRDKIRGKFPVYFLPLI